MSRNKNARPPSDVIGEGMDVQSATAPPVDPEDASDLVSGSSEEPDITERLTIALEALAQKQVATGGTTESALFAAAMNRMAEALERVSEGQLKGSKLVADATIRAQRPSNEFAPKISVFNLRGEKDFPKDKLKCRMLIPWEAEEDSLTREEVELLNLMQPGEYIVVRNDRTKVKLYCRVSTNLDSDVPALLIINHDTAFNNDYHRMMPPLTEVLRQMLKQNPKSRNAEKLVLSMEEEEALILAGKLNDGSTPTDGTVISVGQP